jgi:hypothetical protein
MSNCNTYSCFTQQSSKYVGYYRYEYKTLEPDQVFIQYTRLNDHEDKKTKQRKHWETNDQISWDMPIWNRINLQVWTLEDEKIDDEDDEEQQQQMNIDDIDQQSISLDHSLLKI